MRHRSEHCYHEDSGRTLICSRAEENESTTPATPPEREGVRNDHVVEVDKNEGHRDAHESHADKLLRG